MRTGDDPDGASAVYVAGFQSASWQARSRADMLYGPADGALGSAASDGLWDGRL